MLLYNKRTIFIRKENLLFMSGKLKLIYGNMYAKKSTTLIKEIKHIAKETPYFEVIKPTIDNRYSTTHVVTHDGKEIRATMIVSKSVQVLSNLSSNLKHVFIDEINFFSLDEGLFNIVDVIKLLLSKGVNVTCAGLLYDFRHEYFPVSKMIYDLATEKLELFSRCNVCNEQADRTQRLVDGHPAKYSDDIILVGSLNTYEPRCKKHHEIVY